MEGNVWRVNKKVVKSTIIITTHYKPITQLL